MNKTRLEAFSDGVLAIIITIMVLELRVPELSDWSGLLKLYPVFVSYLMSFLLLAIYWNNHHHLIHTVKKTNAGILWANMNLLFWLSLQPFVTAWMGKNHFSGNTIAAYAILQNICGFSYYILLRQVQRVSHERYEYSLRLQQTRGILSTFAYLLAIPGAYFHPAISWTLFIGTAVVWLVPDRNIERKAMEENDGSET